MKQRPILVLASSLVFAITSTACATSTISTEADRSPSLASPTTTPPPPTTLSTTPPKTQPPQPSFVTFEDGTHRVGEDIRPGTYRTREGSENCYWARLKGFTGDFNEIIANDNTNYPAVVTIRKKDEGFESSDCGTWTNDLSQITSRKTEFESGTFIVRTDIAPGTYKSTGGENCYWARLKGFTGDFNEIIANDNTSSPTVVRILKSDKGFISNDCGTWSKG